MKETDETAPPLVFQWERRRRAHWRLAGLVALSLLVHAIGFYVFQASYTPTGSQLTPSVQVTMARAEQSDGSPEGHTQARALAQWLAVADPALTTQPVTPEGDRQPGDFVRYVPSYEAAPPAFRPLDPPAVGSAPPPRPRPPGPVPVPESGVPPRPANASPPTRLILTGGIESLVAQPLPTISLSLPAGTKTLGPTTFLVGVRPEGGEPFLFREASSGEVAADDFAQDYLSRLRFQPVRVGTGTSWGWAEFRWGRDVYR